MHSTINYYIPDIFRFSIEYQVGARQLRTLLAPYETRSRSNAPGLQLVLCKNISQVTAQHGKRVSGRYKLVPWTVVISENQSNAEGRIFFVCPLFCSFLTLRIVLLPYLKRELVKRGMASIIASVFQLRNHTFIVSGFPGRGKTTALLNASDAGAEFIGDNDIICARHPEAFGIQPLFDQIELRFDTARRTSFWDRLSLSTKIVLMMYHVFSLLTLRRITFGVTLKPARIGIQTFRSDAYQNVTFIFLDACPKSERVSVNEMVALLLNYEQRYVRHYGDLFYSSRERDLLAGNLSAFLHKCSIWRAPKCPPPHELLKLASTSTQGNAGMR